MNAVDAASLKLHLGKDDDQCGVAGWGVFPRFDRRLVPTDPNAAGMSQWRLPPWLYPDGNKPPSTYHPDHNAGGTMPTTPTCEASAQGSSSCWISRTTPRPSNGCPTS